MLRFSEEHEWIEVNGDIGTVGITDYAQSQLGDIVFVEVPEVGRKLTKGGEAAVVESVKAASDVYSPVTGEVSASNATLAENPGLVNSAPRGEGWFFKVKLTNKAELDTLMDEAAYNDFVKGLH